MYQSNQLPSFNDAFSNPYFSSLGLVEQEQQFDYSEQQSIYQGMSVRVVSPFPIGNSEPACTLVSRHQRIIQAQFFS